MHILNLGQQFIARIVNKYIYIIKTIMEIIQQISIKDSHGSDKSIEIDKEFENKYKKNEAIKYIFEKKSEIIKKIDKNNKLFSQEPDQTLNLFVQELEITDNISLRVYLKMKQIMFHIQIILVKSDRTLLVVQSKSIKLLLNRYFITKLNCNLLGYYYRIDFQTGIITFNQRSLFTSENEKIILYLILRKQNEQKQQINISFLKKYFETELNMCYQLIIKHLLKILFIVGVIDEGKYKETKLVLVVNKVLCSNSNQKDIKTTEKVNRILFQLSDQDPTDTPNQIIQFIKKVMIYNRFVFEFMYDAKVNKFRIQDKQKRLKQAQNERKQHIEAIKKIAESQGFLQKIYKIPLKKQAIIQILQNSQKWVQRQKYREAFIKYLILPTPRTLNQADNTLILSSIYVYDIKNKLEQLQETNKISQGGFSFLYRLKIKFIYVDQNLNLNDKNIVNELNKTPKTNELTKLMVIKRPKTQEFKAKINHEKSIIENIKNLSSPYITKFYKTNQKQFSDDILMDFYQNRTFEKYLKENNLTMTIMTKLYVLCQIIQGLMLLHQNGIAHLDIKTPNILVGKGLMLRLTDFGESYHSKVCENTYKPGYSMPYVAPEAVTKDLRKKQITKDINKNNIQGTNKVEPEQKVELFDEKTDVYSFGVLLYEVIAGQYPINTTKLYNDNLIAYYQYLRDESNEKVSNKNKNNVSNHKLIINPEISSNYGPQKIIHQLIHLCLQCMSLNKQQRPLMSWILIQLRQSIVYIDNFY